ncbi:SurA N-terminal domain-containing protein [Kocuria rosea]|uniref:Peptidylprolyl isomerase n=1 Tax=Kocuria rosea TaxID=1275 RepID=A0A4R5YE46_KOCRO|nr:SurA N-terminal domain-containing protein [Kocuria rosea]TDL43014.1 peptidylprolyl isomerase [Kocuria rosea]
MNKNKMTAMLALISSLSMVVACGAESDPAAQTSSGQEASQETGSSAAEAPSPDLNGVPEVVATVNGEDIGKDEFTRVYENQFQQATLQAQMSGQEPDQDALKKSAVESMVGTELLIQEAQQQEIEATEAQIGDALAAAAESNQVSEDEFLAALEEQGTDRDEVTAQLKQQVEVETVVEKEIGTFSATGEELQAAYDEAKAQHEQMPAESSEASEMPSYEEVKPQLKQQVVQEKEGTATQELVEELHADSDVEVKI